MKAAGSEKKLIIDAMRHNCPNCGTKSANYDNIYIMRIDTENGKHLHAMFIRCCVCDKISMHIVKNLPLSNSAVKVIDRDENSYFAAGSRIINEVNKIDENIIMSIPTPSFVIDTGIPKKLRDLLIEALKCVRENALTGASACIRKAIYEFLEKEKAEGGNYDEKIRFVKKKYSQIEYFWDVLTGIKGITSDQVHEDSFLAFNSNEAKSYVAILEEIFKEVYVIPEERKRKKENIMTKYGLAQKTKKQG